MTFPNNLPNRTKILRLYRYLFIILTIATPAHAEKYTTKSIFHEDYKCSADTQGGFNHRAYGHKLVNHRPDNEFYLMHISNIPENAIFEMAPKDIINEDSARIWVENRHLKQKLLGGDLNVERSAYFIREPDYNPKDAVTYVGSGCKAWKDGIGRSLITCFENSGDKSFQFQPNTGRFVYAYLGSWHFESSIENYYGDSSSFTFGRCEKYYR